MLQTARQHDDNLSGFRIRSKLFSRLEKKAFVDALGISREVLHEQAGIADVLEAAADRLQERAQDQERRMAGVFKYADELTRLATRRASEASKLTTQTLRRIDKNFSSWCDDAHNDSAKDDYFHFQIIEAAKKYGYFANTRTYRSWVRLSISTKSRTEILLSFHCLGPDFRGVMVCSALTYRREGTGEKGPAQVSAIDIVAEEPFQFNYNDHIEVLVARFDKWVDTVLVLGFDIWRRSL